MEYSFQLTAAYSFEDSPEWFFKLLPWEKGMPIPRAGEEITLDKKKYYISQITWEYQELENVISTICVLWLDKLEEDK